MDTPDELWRRVRNRQVGNAGSSRRSFAKDNSRRDQFAKLFFKKMPVTAKSLLTGLGFFELVGNGLAKTCDGGNIFRATPAIAFLATTFMKGCEWASADV